MAGQNTGFFPLVKGFFSGKPVMQSDGISKYKHLFAAGSTIVQSGQTVFAGFTVNNPAAGSTITIYNGVDATGDVIGVWSGATPGEFNAMLLGLATGLFVVIAGGTPDVTFRYR